MKRLIKNLKRITGGTAIVKDERGLSTVEYVIILVLLAVMAIVTWRNFGDAIKGQVQGATNDVNDLRSGESTQSQ